MSDPSFNLRRAWTPGSHSWYLRRMTSKKRRSRASRRTSRGSRGASRLRYGNTKSETDRLLSGRGPYYYEHDVDMRILLDLQLPHRGRGKRFRTAPYPGSNVVYDRAYKKLDDAGFIRWVQAHPQHTSLSDDHYVLTDKGREAVKLYDAFMKRIATPAHRR